MSLSLSLKILENNDIISQRISYALIPQINKYLDKVYLQIKDVISGIIVDSIQSQPEYSSLISGELRGQFGLIDPEARLSEILSTIRSGANIVKKPTSVVNSKIKGGITFQMVQSDFQDILSLGSSSFVSENGSRLDWLKWLLLEGDNVIISDYYFIEGPYPNSRTGMGIMSKFPGSFWRVPPEFAGNINDNWITRGINNVSSIIEQQLQNAIR